MATILFNSDIARLVLGYLKQQGLHRAARIFCETSPHLKEELTAYKCGVQALNFFPELAEIISEYVKIQQKVAEVLPSLSDLEQTKVRNEKLSIKISFLLEQIIKKPTNNDVTSVQNESSETPASGIVDKENNSKRTTRKRKRPLGDSSDSSMQAFRQGLRAKKKRRSTANNFYYLNPSPTTCMPSARLAANCLSDDEVEDEEENDDSEVSMSGRPSSESTPRNSSRRKKKPPVPKVTEISDAILDNPVFQLKLVDNINKALKTNKVVEINPTEEPGIAAAAAVRNQAPVQEAPQVSSADILDQLVKNIMEATEKDPAFDEIIEEIVGSSTKSAGVQCQLDEPATAESQIPTLSSAPIPFEVRTPVVRRNMMVKPNALTRSNGSPNSSLGSLIDPNFSLSKLIVVANESGQQKTQTFPGIGNVTADQLLSQLALANETPSTSTGEGTTTTTATTTEQQVQYDASTGQLSFPLYLNNNEFLEGVPFIINNELAENLVNSETGRIELTFGEPFVITGNAAGVFKAMQAEPKQVEVQGEVVEMQAQFSVEQREEQEQHYTEKQPQIKLKLEQLPPSTTDNNKEQLAEAESDKLEDALAANVESAALDADNVLERNTPKTLGVVNTKFQKSLSTPRRRTTHVRALFSPISSRTPGAQAGATPLSTRREPYSRKPSIPAAVDEHEEQQVLDEEAVVDKSLATELRNANLNVNLSLEATVNESSNSCHVPPLFVAAEENANQTIIVCEKSVVTAKPPLAKLSNALSNDAATPKRRQVREKAVRACKRQLSKSSNDSNTDDKGQLHATLDIKQEQVNSSKDDIEGTKIAVPQDATKENQENLATATKAETETAKKDEEKDQEALLEEWRRLRSETNIDLDARLREINSKWEEKNPRKIKRRQPRKKSNDLKKKKGESSEERRRQMKKDRKNVSLKESKQHTAKKNALAAALERKTLTPPSMTATTTTAFAAGALADEKYKKHKEFNIKIPTPQKSAEKSKRAEALRAEKLAEQKVVPTIPITSASTSALHAPKIVSENSCSISNMDDLLATPMKDSLISGCMLPPTPGMLLAMPSVSITPTFRCPELTSMYLFGSATKSELNSPLMSAITPGLRPLSQETTPETGVPIVEYSSGASYYKPDESEDLDRKIDKMLRDSAKKKRIDEENQEKQEHHSPAAQEENEITCVEIPAEKLKVESVVLKRVKSCNELITAEEPHYTLASGIPDCVEDDASCSSSTNSSTSSSDSSSSSTFSTSSSSSSSSDEVDNENDGNDNDKKVPKSPKSTKSSKSLDRSRKTVLEELSEISSCEDEEWDKIEADIPLEEENSQLVSNDGEVRYPVRTWMTPLKEPPTKVTVTLPIKTPEKRGMRQEEVVALKSKLERMKDKCKRDAELNARKKSAAVVPATATVQRKRGRPRKICPVQASVATKSSTVPLKVEEAPQIAFCSALQLTAASVQPKKLMNKNDKETKYPPVAPFADIDENAVSIDINKDVVVVNKTGAQEKQPQRQAPPKSPSKIFIKTTFTEKLAIASTKTIGTPRRCLPIEPQAAPLRGRRKKSITTKSVVIQPISGKKLAPATLVSPPTIAVASSGKKDDGDEAAATTTTATTTKTTTTTPTCATNTKSPRAKIRVVPATGHVGVSSIRSSSRVLKAKMVLIEQEKALADLMIMNHSPEAAIKTEAKVTKNIELRQKVKPETLKIASKRQEKDKSNEDINKKEKKLQKPDVNEPKKRKSKEMEKKTPSPNTSLKSLEQEKPKELESNQEEVKETTASLTPPPLPKMEAVKPTPPPPPPPSPTPAPSAPPSPPPPLSTQTQAASPPPPPPQSPSALAPSATDDDDEDEEDSEMSFITITESDKKHFIKLTYQGPDDEAPAPPEPPESSKFKDLENYKITIALSENEKHTWSISENICLFENKPWTTEGTSSSGLVRTVPKKRKICIISGDRGDTTTEVQAAEENRDISKESFITENPTATSTPTTVKTPAVEPKHKEVLTELKRKSKTNLDKEKKTKDAKAQEKAPKSSKSSTNATTKLMEMEDIESILSHLHGES